MVINAWITNVSGIILCTQEAQEQARKDAEVRRKKIEALRVRLVISNQMHSVLRLLAGNENKLKQI